jgi:NNP family nitrate/nitrite transporter-like MFS transporter
VRLSVPLSSRGGAPLEPLEIHLSMSPALFTFVVFVLGIAMGIGKAAVYKHIPHYFPDRVGAVGGLVGVIGGLGGFVMPILFGALVDRTKLPTTTFLFLFALSAACLAWMIVVVHQLTRAAAPRVAQELDSEDVAFAEFAAGGGAMIVPLDARRRSAKIAAGSE